MRDQSELHPKISVVIPMYNCEQFVPDLLGMFSEQSLGDFEVVCVIDGATDGTEEAVKEYCKTDDRFRYVARENGGAGAARNTGLDMAKGRYIIWVDADDEYSPDFLKKLYETAVRFDAQIVVCRFEKINKKTHEIVIHGFNPKEYHEGIVYSHCCIDDIFISITARVTNKLFNTEFVRKNGLRFSETRISNDTFFGCASLSIADRILFVHDSLLTYRVHINDDSLTDKRVRFLHEAIIVLKELYNWLKDRSLMDIHGEDYYRRTDYVLYLEGARGATPRFISDFAHMLNAEEPWDRMTSGEILEFLKRSILVEDDIRKESELSRFSPELLESDVKLLADYNNCKNRIHMANLLRQVCKERYGRDFEQDGNFSVTSQSNFDHFVIDSNEYKVAVSVIIPMYDCEGFVRELLMILKNQSFERFEVICVIDGATDQTEKLVAEFCKTDARFSYVVQENLGAGSARNAGLELAKGEYIIWIDADDLYSTELIEELYAAAKHTGADMAMCLAEIKDYRTGIEKEKHGFDTDVFPDGEPVKPKDLKVLRRAIDVGIQYKMFKKAFIDKNRLFFSCTHISNDWFFDHAGRISANSIVAVHKKLVRYRKHINRSSITSKRELYLEDSVRVMRELWHWLKNEGYLPEYKDYFISAVDGGMSYNIRFNKNNNRFIKEIAKTINEDEPWKNMDTELLSKSLKLSVFGENRFIKMYEEGIRKAFLSNDEKRDDEQNKQELAEYASALSTIRSVREMSAEQYGHILKPLPKVSVILPVYNVEKYIGACIRSLKKQTLKEMEFIFIDDGSTDGSMSVIESFAKEDNRVRVYSNGKNKGAGAARNHGIDISFGEYLAFMDPDDYVEDDFYERLYRKATEGDGHDIAKGCRKEVSVHGVENGSDHCKLNKRIKSRLNEKKPLYTVFSYEHQTALFRHSLFDDRDARYGNTKKAEDVFFLFVICNKTNDIVFDEASVYYYVQRAGSLLSELSVEKHLSGLESLKDTINWIKSKRKINQYDHKYFADKLYARYKSYKSDMEKSPVLKNGYDSFLKELLLIINLTEAHQDVLGSNTKLKGVFEAYNQL